MGERGDTACGFCLTVNRRKRLIQCVSCNVWFHLSCVALTRAQATAIERWSCTSCRGVSHTEAGGQRPDTLVNLNLSEYIGKCRSRLRVLNRIPKGAVIAAAGALQVLIRGALDQRTLVAWGRLLSFCYWGLGCPREVDEGRKVSLATMVLSLIHI